MSKSTQPGRRTARAATPIKQHLDRFMTTAAQDQATPDTGPGGVE